MADAAEAAVYHFQGTEEEEKAKTVSLALPEDFYGTWEQRKENGVENYSEYLTDSGMGMIKRKLVEMMAKNSFEFILAKANPEGKDIENGYYYKSVKPKEVICEIPLGNIKTQVKLPKGEVDMRSYVLGDTLIVETYHEKGHKSYEKITRTVKDGLMTQVTAMTTAADFEKAAAKDGKKPEKPTAFHTRYLVKKA